MSKVLVVAAIAAGGYVAYTFAKRTAAPAAPVPVKSSAETLWLNMGGLATAVGSSVTSVKSAWQSIFPPKAPATPPSGYSPSVDGYGGGEAWGYDAGGAPIRAGASTTGTRSDASGTSAIRFSALPTRSGLY